MDTLIGKLLVATPQLADPNFERSVVFVCAHSPSDGALGVIINRPTPVPVGEVIHRWAAATSEPGVFFDGGPVAPQSVIAVAVAAGNLPDGSAMPVTGRFVTVDLDSDPGSVSPGLVGARLFLGYSGWGTGQLEAEISQNSWFVVDSREDDLLTVDTGDLWERVLERQGGIVAAVPRIPDDPEVN